MREMVGIITVVQEGRFRLDTKDGRSQLFVLSRKAALEPQDLLPLLRGGEAVTVRHQPLEGRVAGLAQSVERRGERGFPAGCKGGSG